MLKFAVIFFALIVACSTSWALDEFDGIKCGADIPKALTGKHDSKKRVVVLEARHRDLGLKDLGGAEISDRLFLVSWLICDSEYALLINTKKNLIRDVLPVPAHSLRSPQSFVEGCQVAGKEIPDAILAILDNRQAEKPKGYLERIVLPAKVAWKIDESQERFVPMPTQGLSCSVSGSSGDVKQ